MHLGQTIKHKAHTAEYMWYYSFQNYKMVTVDMKLNIYYKWKPCSFTFQ